MGLELATTNDLLQLEERIISRIESLMAISNESVEVEGGVIPLSELRKSYVISEKPLVQLIDSGELEVVKRSDKPKAKRLFYENEIKKFFPRRPSI
ncbi:MAG: hypothetical protein ACTSU6_06095 [Candidatus Njordarchaeales archaeon]